MSAKLINTIYSYSENLFVIAAEKRFYPYLLCWDIECFFSKEHLPQTANGKLEYQARHNLASVSVTSNVPDFDEPFTVISEGDEQKLMETTMQRMVDCSKRASSLLIKEYYPYLKRIDEEITLRSKSEMDALMSICGDDEEQLQRFLSRQKTHPLQKLKSKLMSWLTSLPCFSFNGGKYDMECCKQYIVSFINRNVEGGVAFVVKNGLKYKVISSKALTFLDVLSYLPGNTSYARYLKSFGVDEEKFFFPYEAFNSLDFLKLDTLPPHSAYYSSLKQANISVADYERCQEVWTREGFKDMADYLRYYSSMDVIGMLKGLKIQKGYFMEMGLCLSKDAISLPGLASKYLFRTMPPNTFFSLYKSDPEFYDQIRSAVRGGISMIFNRYQEAGVTKIREDEFGDAAKDTKSIMGFDVSGMYLSVMMQPQPVGE